MNMGRRGILKLLGVAPAAGPALAALVTSSASGLGVGTLSAAALANYPTVGGSSSGVQFLEFASWLAGGGKKEISEQSKDVRLLDPDIAMMHCPLNTKMIWQRERNYQRILANKKSWFEKRLASEGFVQDWFS